ncbi:MAG TPA: ATP-grasp domain-containing protein [Burkholderiaceae bacterium]|nr:ATP-grasp domain-containing protein [Burkholderiaceae bacterium]
MKRVWVYEHFCAAASAPDAELLAAGRAMRDAVVRDLLLAGDCAVSVATGPHAPELPAGARPIAMPANATPAAFVATHAPAHDHVWAIAPETGGALALLQRAVGAPRWLGCDAASIAIASSKRATLARAAEQGLETPLAFAASPVTRRWVVKPDDGAGALATRLHPTLDSARDDAARRCARGEAAVIESWVVGEPLSLSLLCGERRAELLAVNRQQIAVDALGVVSFGGVQIAAVGRADARFAVLAAWAQSLWRALPGLRGCVGVDLVWHAQRGPVLIEVNPRVTMAYVGLSAALGRNVAAAVLAAHAAEPAHA